MGQIVFFSRVGGQSRPDMNWHRLLFHWYFESTSNTT